MTFQTLLLIDDDEDDQEIFITAAGEVSRDVSCLAFHNAREALDKLSRREISADVIFLDLNMPIMDGHQFLAEIKKNPDLTNIPIIIFSTSSHPNTIKTVKAMGAHDFITKPGLYDELVSILRPILT